MELLKANGKVVVEDGGVMPNPTVEKLAEGVRIARGNQADLLLALGGGSCCDYAKAVSVFVHCEEDPWKKYFSGEDDNTSDYISEALMKSVIHSFRIAIQNLEDYEARSNIMWTATWALNTLIAKGKSADWMSVRT